MNSIRSLVVPALLFGSVVVSAHGAEACLDNFTAEGNFFSGKVYKTFADVKGVRADEAFARVARFTAENGFTIATADKSLGLISASQSVTAGQGKSVPLSIAVQPEGSATRIALTYSTSTGVMSPEESIKKHFCMTVASAGGK